MKNRINSGDKVEVVVSEAVVSGEFVQIGSLYGVASKDAAADEAVVIERKGAFTLPKDNSNVAVGDDLYYSATLGQLTKTATDNKLVAVALAVAGTSATEVSAALI